MKRIIALVLCLGVLFTSNLSFAAVDESYKSVLDTVKSRIPSTDEYENFSVNQNISGGVKTYQFSWRNEETKKYMEVECRENGIITRFNSSADEVYQEKAMSDISKEQALKKAKDAFFKLNPDLQGKILIKNGNQNKQLWETRQHFLVSRVENGIEVYGDTGHIEMDINADKILWYYLNWNDYADFPNPEDAISLEDAKKIFADKLGLHLIYKAKVEDGKIKPYLVYTIKNESHNYVDMNGEIVQCNPYLVYAGAGSLTNDKVMMESMSSQLSEAEIAEMEKLDGLISQEQAMKIVENEQLFNLQDFKIENVSLSRDHYDKEKYTYSFIYNSESKRLKANVTVDAKSGEILNFSKPDYDEKETQISKEQAQQTLTDAVKTLCKTNFDEYEFIENELVKNQEYSVEYNRVVNEIKFPYDFIRANVNKYTGELSYYSKVYSNAEFPPKDNVISLNSVYKCAYNLFPYGLKYVPSYEGEKAKINLVFAFSSESFDIDPFTGEEYNYNDEDEALEYDDLEGHYAQKHIEELASYGIGLGINKFMPDNKIRQKELIFLLVKAFYKYYSPYLISEKEINEDYEIAIREGIIKKEEIDKEAFVTRKDAAKFFVNAMGYGTVAQAESIFNCPFIDVSENKGSISILYGLNIVNGDETGKFNPDDYLLRGDTMIMFYKYLSK